MDDYKKLCDLIHHEIDKEVNKGSLTPDSIRTIGYAIDVVKDIKTIEAMEEYGDDGYSGHYPDKGWRVMPYYAYDDMPERSYARRRDSMGRYSRDNHEWHGGYSRDENIDHLERMMNTAKSDQEREAIRKLIVQMENG